MLPALIHRVVLATGLMLILVVALAWPARHTLVPLWPVPVEERLYRTAEGEILRRLNPVGHKVESSHRLVARHRPANLLVVEMTDAGSSTGFLAGVRAGPEGELMEQPPAWLSASLVVPPAGSAEILIIETIDEQLHELPTSSVRRLHRPNRMSPVQRAGMALDSLVASLSRDRHDHGLPEQMVFSPAGSETR